jgi:hypothetical protein
MKGTEKQIKWAEDIQKKLIADFEKELKKLEPKKERPAYKKRIAEFEAALNHVKNVTDAGVLIRLKNWRAMDLRVFVFENQVDFEKRIWQLG